MTIPSLNKYADDDDDNTCVCTLGIESLLSLLWNQKAVVILSKYTKRDSPNEDEDYLLQL